MAISRGNKTDLGINGGTTNSLTAAHAVDVNSNWLFVGFLGDTVGGFDDITGVTYNGVSMSLLANMTTGLDTNDRFLYLYHLQNPATGSHNVVISSTNNHYLLGLAIDYGGVGSLGTPASGAVAYPSDSPTTHTLTVNTTINVVGSWDLWLQGIIDGNGGIGGGWGTMTSTNLTFQQSGAAVSEPNFWDSNGTVSTGTFGANNTGARVTSTTNISIYAISVALEPVVADTLLGQIVL